jgi:hypothetical protein
LKEEEINTGKGRKKRKELGKKRERKKIEHKHEDRHKGENQKIRKKLQRRT